MEVFGGVDYARITKKLRWGIDAEPKWIDGGEIAEPPSGRELVSVTVPEGRSGYVFGFFMSATEANDFKLNWVEDGVLKSIRIILPSRGSVHYADFIYLCRADGNTSISITNVNDGTAGSLYQARLLCAIV